MYQLRTEGGLSDLSKVSALLSVAKRYVITDAGWNLLDFAAQMRGLTSRGLVFHTLPIKGYATIDGQDANEVNVPYLQRIVHDTFYPQPGHKTATPHPTVPPISKATASRTTVDVFNGGTTAGLAGRVSAALVKQGFKAGTVANTTAQTTTSVLYGAGASANAAAIATMFGVTAVRDTASAAGTVQVLLGANTGFPTALAPAASASPSSIIPTAGPQGGAVIAAKDGIPCVN
jgi:hypothetical protein